MSYVIGRVGGSAAKLPEDMPALLDKGHELMPDAEWRFMPGDAALAEYAKGKPWIRVYERDGMPVPDFLAQCDLFFFPVSDRVHDQGPRVIVEAMAAGLPVVAENRDGAKDRVLDGVTGYLVNDRQNMPLAIRAIREDGCGPEMGRRGRERARGWTPEAWADKIIENMLAPGPEEAAPPTATTPSGPTPDIGGGVAVQDAREARVQCTLPARPRRFLVHIRAGQGLGNICCAIPMIKALAEIGTVDVWNQAGYHEVIDAIGCVQHQFFGDNWPRVVESPHEPVIYDAVVPLCYFGGVPGYPELEAKVPKIEFDRWQTSETRANFLRAVALGYAEEMPDGLLSLPKEYVREGAPASYIVLADCAHPGKAAQKRWPYWRELADSVDSGYTDHGIDVAWVGRDHDKVIASIPELEFDARGNTTIPALMALLHYAKFVVANDCGVAHLACAMGADTLILFGPTNDVKNKPESPHAHVMRSIHTCQDCQKNKVVDAGECPSRCLKALTAEEVWEKAKNILEGRKDG